MLSTILNLFGRSPFAPLGSHMEKVGGCVHLLPDLFDALQKQDFGKVGEITEKISYLEHQADLTKNDIRNHLPKSLFLPIDRGHLLEILAIQDHIADAAEDVAILIGFKQLSIPDEWKDDFNLFLFKNIAAFDGAQAIIKELHELLESSFGGIEAQKVRTMVEEVAFREHEVDIVQRVLLKKVYQSEHVMSYASFFLWQRIFLTVASISNLSENLANRIRMTLELK